MSEITKPIILDETGRRIADALGLIAIAQAGSAANIESWESVQQIVRNGLGPKAFPVGARLASAHTAYTSIEWDVVAHNQHKKPGDDSAPTMTLLMHACIYGRMIDASEMLWANTGESALPAGTYNFTLYKGGNSGQTGEDGTYQFTTTEPIPAGGGWTHNKVGNWYEDTANYKPENITSGVVTTYDASGNQIGYLITSTSAESYGGNVQIAVGISNEGELTGIGFLSISDTPGLGMRAKEPDFKDQFIGKKAENLEVTKTGASADNQIEAISGATITSKAVTNATDAAIYFVANCLAQ